MSWWSDILDNILPGHNPNEPGLVNVAGNAIGNYLDTESKDIFNGLSLGFEKILSDIWTVIQGPLEIGLGVGIFIFAMVLLFQGQILSVAPLLAAMA